MNLRSRFLNWEARRTLEDSERERVAFLHKPPAPNPPELMTPTRCRVLRPFGVAGKRVEPGQVIELAAHDAFSMVALKRVEIFLQ